jgi:hypothetical protein
MIIDKRTVYGYLYFSLTKKEKPMKPSKRKVTVLTQICKLIPGHLVDKLAREHGVDKQSRTFSPWSHTVSLLYAQLSHSLSLNDVCDALANHESALIDIRGATPPKRNTLSNANRHRNADMAEALFLGSAESFDRSIAEIWNRM